ncbi:hypothetical protein BH10BAC5_BH10BAC5_00490 [soil metagenome]
MKKINFLLFISIFVFLQFSDILAETEVKGMDMNAYANWVGLIMIAVIFAMFSLFLIYQSEEHPENNPKVISEKIPGILFLPEGVNRGTSLFAASAINMIARLNKLEFIIISSIAIYILLLIISILK